MESFKLDNIQAEKAKAILKYRKLRRIANLFRFVEACVVLVLISRLSIQLPVAIKNSSEYFRDFSVFMISPSFVFVIGNVIIITLFALSGQFSAHGSTSNSAQTDIYQEFIKISTKNQRFEEQSKHLKKQSIRTEDRIKSQRTEGDQIRCPEQQSMRAEDSIKNPRIDKYQIKYPENQIPKAEDYIQKQRIEGGHIKRLEKQRMKTGDTNSSLVVKDYRRRQTENLSHVHSVNSGRVQCRSETENNRQSFQLLPAENSIVKQRIEGDHIRGEGKQSIKTGDTNISLVVKDYRRCQTENLSRVHTEKSGHLLRRSDTENNRKNFQLAPAEKVARTSYPEDNMSNDEFRCAVEAFIARQQRLRKEEEDSVI